MAEGSAMRLVRVLCFHGAGTNIRVMEHQTKKLREMLGNRAQFDYVEGKIPWTNVIDPIILSLYLVSVL